MISRDDVRRLVPGLTEADLERFLDLAWVRPTQEQSFAEIDVARVRLIVELRRELGVEEPTLPLVLSLLDQLYAARAALRHVIEALDPPSRDRVREVLRSHPAGEANSPGEP